MSTQSNRVSTEWPSRHPLWTYTSIAMAVLVFAGLLWAQYWWGMTFVQRLYLPIYIKTGLRAAQSPSNQAQYALIDLANAKGQRRFAVEGEVAPIQHADGSTVYAITPVAIQRGWARPEWEVGWYRDRDLHAYLGHWIYHDQPLTKWLRSPAYGALAVWAVLLCFALPLDRKRSLVFTKGRRLRGPEMVTTANFNRRMRGRARWAARLLDGVTIIDAAQSWLGKTFSNQLTHGMVIPQEREAQGFMALGDTGAGKSAFIRQLMLQARQRGEIAVVYDPAGEFVQQVFDPDRDVIVNVLDDRCPDMDLFAVDSEAEALSLAASLFPDRPHENRFFAEAPRKIFAYLIMLKPTAQELTQWLSHPEELDQRVRGTELAPMIDPHAPAQRAGVLASLNMVADALKLLPCKADTKSRWSVTEWAKQRKGWVFITSGPTVRERLRPLISLLIDQLILRCMDKGSLHAPKTWFFLDEVASSSLQRLPQLEVALMECRKANCVLVLGFQGKAQIEALYGHVAEAMLSQPATKVFFKTAEANAADWISRTIGEIEIERFRESRTHGQFPRERGSESHQRDIVREPLVLASEVAGLEPLHCYIKHGNFVVHLRTVYLQLPTRHPAFIPREAGPTGGPAVADHANQLSTPPLGSSGQQLGLKPSTQQQQFFQ